MTAIAQRLLSILASLRLTVVGLILLTILTIWGTIYQAEFGLFLAQERFYESWFFLIGGVIPFPGGQLVMTALFVNLGASVAAMAIKRRLTIGFALTHLGLAMLLAAGAVTYYLGQEAHLSLEEGGASNVAVSSEDWELAILPANGPVRRMVTALDAGLLKAGQRIPLPDDSCTLRVEQYYRNAQPQTGGNSDRAPESVSGATSLKKQPLSKEPSENFPGTILAIEKDGKVQSRVLLWGGDGAPVVVELGDGPRAIGLRRERLPLPATIELVDFKRELHPGTGMAKSYSSQVFVRTGEAMKRKVLIAMNKPLRLNGFTFYQSSFSSAPDGREVSTFAVVQNHGRLIPYIATGLTGLGMVIHFAGLLISRIVHARRKEVAS